MNLREQEPVRYTIEDAVDIGTRVLGLQLDLCPGSRAAIASDRFATGYLWGFCGGALTALRILDADLYLTFSIASRQILPERDAVRILAGIPGLANDADFQDGEAAGIGDAIRCIETDRPPLGLVLHLARG